MIITFIILLLANVWAIAIQWLPTGSLPTGISTAIATTISWLYVANIAIDVNTLLLQLGLFFTIELVVLAFEFFFWVYSKIPVVGK